MVRHLMDNEREVSQVAIEPKDMRALMLLISGSGVKVNSADELLQLLRAANKVEVSAEVRKEELVALAQRQEKEHAHQERLREIDHTERMESLERGIPLPDPEVTKELTSLKRASIVAAACVGTVLPAAGFFLGLMCTSLVLHLHELNPSAVAVCGSIWGVVGLVSLVSVAVCLVNILVNRSVTNVAPLRKPIPPTVSTTSTPVSGPADAYFTPGGSRT